MNWFYALNGKQAGPVTEEELIALYRNGTILANTLVWKQGMPNWAPLSVAMPELVAATSPAPVASDPLPPSPTPAPEFAAAPVPLGVPQDSWISEEELLANDYPVDIGGCISRGWETFFKNPWLLLGGSLAAFAIYVAASMIPILGFFAQFVLYGPIYGGVLALYLRQIRTGNTDIGMIFSMFGPRFVQTMLVYLIQTLVVLALMVPVGAGVFGLIMTLGLQGANKANPEAIWNAMTFGTAALVVILVTAITLVIWVLTALWFFAIPLVSDKGYDFWPAIQLSRKMVAKHFWWTVLFFIAIAAVSTLGMIACLIGMFISAPVAVASVCHWYENVFGRLRPKSVV